MPYLRAASFGNAPSGEVIRDMRPTPLPFWEQKTGRGPLTKWRQWQLKLIAKRPRINTEPAPEFPRLRKFLEFKYDQAYHQHMRDRSVRVIKRAAENRRLPMFSCA